MIEQTLRRSEIHESVGMSADQWMRSIHDFVFILLCQWRRGCQRTNLSHRQTPKWNASLYFVTVKKIQSKILDSNFHTKVWVFGLSVRFSDAILSYEITINIRLCERQNCVFVYLFPLHVRSAIRSASQSHSTPRNGLLNGKLVFNGFKSNLFLFLLGNKRKKENIKKQFEISDCFCLLVRATCVQRSGEFRFPSVAFESKWEFMRSLCGGRTAVEAQDLLIEYEKWIYFLRAKAENCVCLEAARRHATPDNQKKQIHD